MLIKYAVLSYLAVNENSQFAKKLYKNPTGGASSRSKYPYRRGFLCCGRCGLPINIVRDKHEKQGKAKVDIAGFLRQHADTDTCKQSSSPSEHDLDFDNSEQTPSIECQDSLDRFVFPPKQQEVDSYPQPVPAIFAG